LLGFFVSNSMHRWYQSATGFLELLDCIRALQFQLVGLGVHLHERAAMCLRYGFLSAWFLTTRLQSEARHPGSDVRIEDEWDAFRQVQNQGGKYTFLTASELVQIENVDDPAGTIWMWVASLVGRMSQDGEIPPMASPTYGRVMQLTELASSAIRKVRLSTSVQVPYAYVHMLAILVHTNHAMNAIAFGVTLGVSYSKVMHAKPGVGKQSASFMLDVAGQDVAMAFAMCIIAPWIQLAILHVAVQVSNPFAKVGAKFPIKGFMDFLHCDLLDVEELAKSTPGWEPPSSYK